MSRVKIEFKTSDGTAGFDKATICRDIDLPHEDIEAESEKFIRNLEKLSRKNKRGK